MDEDNRLVKGKGYIYSAILVLFVMFAWMFYFSDLLVVKPLQANWVAFFGVEFFKDSNWRYLSILMFSTFVPLIIFSAIAFALVNRFNKLNGSAIHHQNIKGLEKAREALQQGIRSIDTITLEYQGKLESYKKLQQQLEELQTVRDIDTEDLRKKLNAIASANRLGIWFDRFVSFFVGIMSSLIAAYLWRLFT